MRLLQRSGSSDFSFTKDLVGDDQVPLYAILSHTWGLDTDEVTFEDLMNSTGKNKLGYEKIRFCGEQARQDGLQYFWIDTCCINKANYTELSQAINSMFHWYQNAAKCYVYLSDVLTSKRKASNQFNVTWESAFLESRWFKRGWTLQELLAPSSVEFFSRDRQLLGNKESLKQQIHDITGITDLALQGAPLSQFSIDERLSWIDCRQTKLEEDKAYSLLGIFDISMPLIYGEGGKKAFKRLNEEIEKHLKAPLQRPVTFQIEKEYIRHLRLTDPRDDKKRIEETKGGLLEDSYRWILENSDFQQWHSDHRSRLLWIKGGPGKGKTMLLCGIVNELKKSIAETELLSYFFCQATDSRINNATAILRGLLYMLFDQQPSLISHIPKKYSDIGKTLFDDPNAWYALSEIFTSILQDPSLNSTFLIIDALDECIADLPKLLDFIVQKSSVSPLVKWVVSSRNDTNIERRLRLDDSGIRLSLELKENAEQVSHAVDVYIDHCLHELTEIQYDKRLQDLVREKMRRKANGTFLWVSLVIKELKDVMSWEVLQVLDEVPLDLTHIYHRMIAKVKQSQRQYPELCRQVLSIIITTYRPLHLQELHVLSSLPKQVHDINQSTAAIVNMCGSFLTVREDHVYIIHQSAKDFLCQEAGPNIFPFGAGDVHYSIFLRSLKTMSKILRRDIYNLRTLGYPIEQVKQPDPDPLVALRYSCIYWVDHLYNWNSHSSANHIIDPQDKGIIDTFIKEHYLYWLEALSLCKSISKGVLSLAKLETIIQGRADALSLIDLVRDARRFIMYHKCAIEHSPLQAYVSALLFSPACSLTRVLFKKEEPSWITIKPATVEKWSACLQTLEGHKGLVSSVAFSHDSTRLASASGDQTVKIWDVESGECLRTLEGHNNTVDSVTFTHDSTRLASAASDWTVKIWDVGSGECLRTLRGSRVSFSHDSTCLASASGYGMIKIWDVDSGKCIRTLEGHSEEIESVAFSHDSTRLASASGDHTVKIWDVGSGKCIRALEGHIYWVKSATFSHDSAWLVSASLDRTVKIWDVGSGECLQTLKGHSSGISSVALSHDSMRLALASGDQTIKILDVGSGECLQTLRGHGGWVGSISFSHNSMRLASASVDRTVKIWDLGSDTCVQTLEGHSDMVNSVALSHDSTRLASASSDRTVKIWDVGSGECLQTLRGHKGRVLSVTFSHNLTRLASVGSLDRIFSKLTVKIWDLESGQCLQTLESHSRWLDSVALSHDSMRLALASSGQIEIWDIGSSQCLQTLEGHGSTVSSVAFSHDSTRLVSASISGTLNDQTVKIWGIDSGKCLQTLGTSKALFNISVDTTDSYINTEIRTIIIDALSASNMTRGVMDPQDPRCQSLDLSSDRVWITYNSENLVWLPSEYRPSCSAALGKTICIGVGSGKVWICKFRVDAGGV